MVIVVQTKKKLAEEPKVNIYSYKNLKVAIEAGSPEGWGKVIDVEKKKDILELGYQPPFEWSKD